MKWPGLGQVNIYYTSSSKLKNKNELPVSLNKWHDSNIANWKSQGMVQAAVYLRKQLRDRQLLQEAFSTDPQRGTHEYELTIVGHSLGAGTAAILAILLQQVYALNRVRIWVIDL